MKYTIIFTLACFLFLSLGNAQSGCPGCQIDLGQMPDDTLFLSEIEAGFENVYFDKDLSFRLPKTTTPVYAIDSMTIPGISISKFKIVGLSNLPPGLSWEVNQDEFDPAVQTDGCAKICGSPLASGQYFVNVELEATVFGIGTATSFAFEIIIYPEPDPNKVFEVFNSTGCGTTEATFVNNIVSNGASGFTYFWNFGNGESSIDENPGSIDYLWPGVYPVTLRAIVDTFPSQMSRLSVISAECKDTRIPPILTGNPDLYFVIEELNGTEIYKSSNLENTDFPADFNVNITLEIRDYRLKVFDDDDVLAGADDLCGEVIFNPNNTVLLKDTVNNMDVLLTFFKPITEIVARDTVIVFAAPPVPAISPETSQVKCVGDIEFTSSLSQNLEWFHDGNVISTDSVLLANRAGQYWVQFTDPISQCSSVSDTASVAPLSFPTRPILTAESPNIKCEGDIQLTSSIGENIEWFFNGIPLSTDSTININEAGTYIAHHTDPNTLCTIISDSLRVDAPIYPNQPEISPDDLQLNCLLPLELSSSATDNVIWYFEGDSISNEPTVFADMAGNYWVATQDPTNACITVSDTANVLDLVYPSTPEFENNTNQLSLLSSVVLPDNYSLQWYLNGDILEGEIGPDRCARTSGLYALIITDNDTGCTSEFEMNVAHDATADCTSSTSDVSDLQSIAKIYPNPALDYFNIEMKNFQLGKWTAELFSIEGKSISKKEFSSENGMMETSAVIPGIYFLRVTTMSGIYTTKVVTK